MLNKAVKSVARLFLFAFIFAFLATIPGSRVNAETPASASLSFSHEGGFYTAPFYLTITAAPGEIIRYTLDGSEPVWSSRSHTAPIPINGIFSPTSAQSPMTTRANAAIHRGYTQHAARNFYNGMVVRARSFHPGGVPASPVVTHSYFVNPDGADMFATRVISLAVEPYRFVGPQGMYSQWERSRETAFRPQANVEVFYTDGDLLFSQYARIHVSGHSSRRYPKKSIRMNFNRGCGVVRNEPRLIPGITTNLYSLEPVETVDTFKKITARTADWRGSTVRETLMSAISRTLRPEAMQFTYAALFINGEFWGMYEVREQTDDVFIAAHYPGIPANAVTMLSFDFSTNNAIDPVTRNPIVFRSDHPLYPFTQADNRLLYRHNPPHFDVHPLVRASVDEGPEAQAFQMYMEFYNAIVNYDLSVQANFERVKELVCIDNMIDFFLVSLHLDQQDWPGNNFRMWATNREIPGVHGGDGRWRFVLNDFDISMGSIYTNRMIAFTTRAGLGEGGPFGDLQRQWGGHNRMPEWAVVIWRSLLENAEFRNTLAARYSTYTGTVFSPEWTNMLLTEIIDERTPDIDKGFFRWNVRGGRLGYLDSWHRQIDHLRWFLDNRAYPALTHIRDYFNILPAGQTITGVSPHYRQIYISRPHLNMRLDTSGFTYISWATDGNLGFFDVAGAQIRPDLYGVPMASAFSANYIRGLPITVTAVPLETGTFVRFDINRGGNITTVRTPTHTFTPAAGERNISVTAVFEPIVP